MITICADCRYCDLGYLLPRCTSAEVAPLNFVNGSYRGVCEKINTHGDCKGFEEKKQ